MSGGLWDIYRILCNVSPGFVVVMAGGGSRHYILIKFIKLSGVKYVTIYSKWDRNNCLRLVQVMSAAKWVKGKKKALWVPGLSWS